MQYGDCHPVNLAMRFAVRLHSFEIEQSIIHKCSKYKKEINNLLSVNQHYKKRDSTHKTLNET